MLGSIEIGIVGDESLSSRALIENRMTYLTDLQNRRIIDEGTRVTEEAGCLGQGTERIERPGGGSRLLQGDDLLEYRGAESLENLDLQRLGALLGACLLYTSPSPRDRTRSRMPSST